MGKGLWLDTRQGWGVWEPVHERELAHQVLRNWDRTPVLFSALERAETQLGGGEVYVAGAERQRLRYPAPAVGQREREGPHGGARVRARRGQKPGTLLARQVFPPARVDQGKPACAMARTIHYA